MTDSEDDDQRPSEPTEFPLPWWNEWVERVYLGELLNQTKLARAAISDLRRAWVLDTRHDPLATTRAFAASQSLLAAVAMISKMLWPDERNQAPGAKEMRARARAGRIRTALDLEGTAPLQPRSTRNFFEHFDEKLDAHFAGGATYLVDSVIGQADAIVVDDAPAVHMRHLDPEAGTISALTTTVSVEDLESGLSSLEESIRSSMRAPLGSPTVTSQPE